jgi:tRNA A37 threonylcarbamoyladenosine synthetase subunit TsaC/SUA5/YrdC
MELAQKFGKPLSTTSANMHGQPNTYSVDEIIAQFCPSPNGGGVGGGGIDLILDSGPISKNPPSTIIDLSHREAKILRS